ncbi:hypothetical protein OYT13_11420 [Pandoraea sp. XJJ-1]|uniref:hypothetical protein n=1 Tax=Pandoraea sp. XJJ-1 TaxID=3002643 RepID=UPI002281D9A7|nr:hypothetical protein [Pandoraea sp. XJJ-1]WAL84956.1 hypothetical protein OYT13_11420 [Pandoraea sp. XJJ-1]
MQTYDINLAAPGANGSMQIIEAEAKIIDFLVCSDPNGSIKVIPDMQQGGAAIQLGQGLEVANTVKRWLIVNTSAGAITGTVLLSDKGFRNSRMFGSVTVLGTVGVSGNVSVIDNSRSLTQSGIEFVANVGVQAAAGQYGLMGVFNPAGSGINAYISGISSVGPAAATFTGFFRNNTAGLTAYGTPNVQNKLAGGAAGKCTMWIASLAAAPPDTALLTMAVSQRYPETQPIVLPPGWGFFTWCSQAGQATVFNGEIQESVS